MSEQFSVGFIGFGEAGFHIAKGLNSEGVAHMSLCHNRKNDPDRTALVKSHAQEAGVEYMNTAKEVIEKSDIILSVVTPSAAVAVAEELSIYLKPEKIYIDLTSSFPEDIKVIASLVTSNSAKFVDGAIMGAVPMHGHKVLIYVSGPQAKDAMQLLNSVGMNLKNIGDEPGQASSTKLIVSIASKGFGALLLEILQASHHFGVTEQVFSALEKSYEKGLPAYINRSIGSCAIDADKWASEMESSVRFLENIRVDPIMTAKSVEMMKWFASLDLKEHFGGVTPGSYKEVLKAWDKIGLSTRSKK
jgi:3-hydroxyisobutyrate dehydrogenase-like beta-hydroxyacid dehydrogenase